MLKFRAPSHPSWTARPTYNIVHRHPASAQALLSCQPCVSWSASPVGPTFVCHARPPRPPRQGSSISSSGPEDLRPREITTLISAAETSIKVLQLVCNLHVCFDGINTVTALHRTVMRLKPAHTSAVLAHPGYALLLQLAVTHAPTLAARGAANGLYSLAKLPAAPSPQLLNAMTASVKRTVPDMNALQVANSMWALARLEHVPASGLLGDIASRAAVLFGDMQQGCQAQNVSNTLWAYASLRADPGQLLMAAAAQRLCAAKDASPQILANSLWAYAKLGCSPGEECLHVLAADLHNQAHKAAPQNISNSMWAFAELGWTPSQSVTDGLLSSMQRCMINAQPQHISNTIWACAKLGVQPGDDFLQAAFESMGAALHLYNPQSIANVMWGCTKLGYLPAPAFTQAATERMLQLMPTAPDQNIANMLWALCMLDVSTPPSHQFMKASSQRLMQLLSTAGIETLCQVATAYAKLQYIPKNALFDHMARRFQELQPTSSGSVALMCKAYRSLGLHPKLSWYIDHHDDREGSR